MSEDIVINSQFKYILELDDVAPVIAEVERVLEHITEEAIIKLKIHILMKNTFLHQTLQHH